MITRIGKTRYLRVAGFAVGAVLIAGIAVVATASAAGLTFGSRPASSSQASDAQVAAVEANASSAVCSDFMKNFAIEIKKTQAEINAAFQRAIADTLANQVKSGQLTQAQADAIKKKLASQTPCTLPSSVGHTGGSKTTTIKAYMAQYITAAAAAFGMTETQLKADLAAGKSLSDEAAARKVSEADFRARLIANLTPVLDKAVTDKKITAAQEQAILSHLKTGELPLWNVQVKRPKPAASPATK